MKIIKLITQNEKDLLIKHSFIKNTKGGYINSKGYHVGFYRTSGGRCYIEDWYADKAKTLK